MLMPFSLHQGNKLSEVTCMLTSSSPQQSNKLSEVTPVLMSFSLSTEQQAD